MHYKGLVLAVLVACLCATGLAATAALGPAPNSDPIYQALRHAGLGNEAFTLKDFVLKRDAGTFTLTGTVCFVTAVQGKVTGAVFTGEGTFALTPPLESERKSLSHLTNQPLLDEAFSELVLRFTDDTYDELKKAGAPANVAACTPGLLDDTLNAQRKKIHYNFTARLLQDVLSQQPGGFFAALIKGKRYNGKELFVIDPHGISDLLMAVAPEEVMFATYDENKFGIWAAFHLAAEYAGSQAKSTQRNAVLRIEKQQIDTNIEKSGELTGKTTTSFVAQINSLRVVPFRLFSKLRVDRVTDAQGQPLSFIQEDKDDDPDFFIILPKPLTAGERYAVTTSYNGKEAVKNEGGGNYYPTARTSWYPGSFDDYATYEMRFAVSKDFKLVATGTPVSEVIEAGQAISIWRSDTPQTVAGFHFGRFKREQKEADGMTLETYANSELPDVIKELQARINEVEATRKRAGNMMVSTGLVLGSMSTTGLAKKAMAEAELAEKIYIDYFGRTPFKRLAMTQHVAMNYGQSWPGLVWLPMSYFYDTTIRHQFGMDDPRGYFKIVGPHEVAHQWWGHTITWPSYRDQWMSEGFADLSASIFLQMVRGPHDFIQFWNDERNLLLERNKEGFRAVDVGPLTLGYRAGTAKTGFDVTRRLIYPKGAYVLHMIRMMMWNPKTGDQAFKDLMHDFIKTYTNRSASTEDFKSMVEKHMLPHMNLDGNGKMDWYFNEYVYGTALPAYKLDYSVENDAAGMVLKLRLAQSNVDDNFKMSVPLYLELADGRVVRLGALGIKGTSSTEHKVSLAGLKERPKRAFLNYFNDVLCEKD